MRYLALILAMIAAPVLAQEDPDDGPGLTLMEEGARLFFRGLMREMEPALDGLDGLADDMRPALRDFAQEMGPALRDLLSEVEDWSVYHPPEIMPNGDIIIRRRSPMDPAEPGAEIEL